MRVLNVGRGNALSIPDNILRLGQKRAIDDQVNRSLVADPHRGRYKFFSDPIVLRVILPNYGMAI